MATNSMFSFVLKACEMAPVPRPPQPIKATLMVSFTKLWPANALAAQGAKINPLAVKPVCFTKSRLVFFIGLF